MRAGNCVRAPRRAPGILRALATSAALAAALVPTGAQARVVSYAPVTSRLAVPAVKDRAARHYALFELNGLSGYSPSGGIAQGGLWLYDGSGAEEPRPLLDGTPVSITVLAVWEREGAGPFIFVGTDARLPGEASSPGHRFLLSTDGGATWKVVPLPKEAAWDTLTPFLSSVATGGDPASQDVGGPLVRGRRSPVRLGTLDFPFVFQGPTGDLWAIGADASAKLLVKSQAQTACCAGGMPPYYVPNIALVGSDLSGKAFLWVGTPATTASTASSVFGLYVVDLSGNVALALTLSSDLRPRLEGWITPAGPIYVEMESSASPGGSGGKQFGLVTGGVFKEVARPLAGAPPTGLNLFAVPTADFTGAWILQRGPGLPTVLSLHRPGGALAEAWRDITGPEVEALHAGADGTRLLVQVHRPRPQVDQRIFVDPSLALWTVGQPAPKRYDELFLNEIATKGFVVLDVDAVAQGTAFVFDSGSPIFLAGMGGGPSGGGAGGGADVTQEWGVVRGSLHQKLVIPAVARAPGRNGAFWKTDVLLENPDPDPLDVTLRFLPEGELTITVVYEKTLTLSPFEIRVLPDVLDALFGLPQGSGALLITPAGDRSLDATSRTYTASAAGTYGMGLRALDVFTAFGRNFDALFSGGLMGPGFRSNLVLTNVLPRPAQTLVTLRDEEMPDQQLAVTAPALGQKQLSGLGDWMGLPAWQSGALVLSPQAGEVLPALIGIDEKTNDPTYFPPDLPSTVTRVIPAVVHADGAGGARFRSDLFLFNPADKVQTIALAVKLWTEAGESILNLTLLPHESKVVRDVLYNVFGRTGVGRLRFQCVGSEPAQSIRVTSRTYTIDATGGTYGLLIPPLNSFQAAGGGEALEILGAQGGADRRTNLSLVELSAREPSGPMQPTPRARVEVFDEKGSRLDSFDVNVPWTGGVQLDDLFRARGLGDGPNAALIRVSPTAGLIGAYATLIDRGTNDPTYLSASLAATD